MIERIVVPLDGSALAEAILTQVRRILKLADAEVVLVRSYEIAPLEVGYEVLLEHSRKEADEYLEGVERRLAADGVRVRRIIRPGPPAETILDVANEERASVIAMSTHGRTGLIRFVRGSVTEKVLRASPVPVLAVHSAQAPGELAFRKIMVTLDGSRMSLQVLGFIETLARPLEAHVTLVQVIEDAKRFSNVPLQEAAHRLERAGIPHSMEVLTGDPATEILEAARRMNPDVLAMTTHGRSGLSRWVFGSVTEKVLRHATVPLLVVRARQEG
ncbi:MAG: universal stress protein [Planctomycetes bacterium]|nr:universal stress protein [Planctomycetota bacterium]